METHLGPHIHLYIYIGIQSDSIIFLALNEVVTLHTSRRWLVTLHVALRVLRWPLLFGLFPPGRWIFHRQWPSKHLPQPEALIKRR